MLRKSCLAALPLCLLFVVLLSQPAEPGKPTRPNILFIIMDDVGIDQMQIFGYGGATPPLTPNIKCDRAGRCALPQCLGHARVFSQSRDFL